MGVPHSPGKITVDEYYEMARVGLIDPDARVELIEGEAVAMAPIEIAHGYVVDVLNEKVRTVVRESAHVRTQGALRLSNQTELLPDLSVLKLPSEQYRERQASASDALLLIEVSEATLRIDLRVKVPLYARYGVPELWIIDLENRCVRFLRSVVDGEYRSISITYEPEIAAIPGVPGASIDLRKLVEP